MTLKTRRADKRDAEEIAKIMISFYNMNSVEEAKKAYLSEIKNGSNFIVIEDENKIVGFTSWIMHGLPKHGLAELDRIVVEESFRGKGVSEQLFKDTVEIIKEFYKSNNSCLRKFYVLTHENNKRAQKFYKKVGFKHETILKSHYYDNLDEYVLSMFLKNNK